MSDAATPKIETKTCNWKYIDPIIGAKHTCDREVAHDEECIFHAEVKDSDEFNKQLEKLVKDWVSERKDEWDFRGFVFPEGISANQITPSLRLEDYPVFPPLTSFEAAIFQGNVYFSNSIFQGNAQFNNAIFKGDTYFQFVEVQGSAYFINATFQDFASFQGAIFHENVFLIRASFTVLGAFNRCSIVGRVRWIWPGAVIKLSADRKDVIKRGKLQFEELEFVGDNGHMDFRENALGDDTRLVFIRCDMTKVLLRRTDCSRIEFYNNTWPRRSNRFQVYDEVHAEELDAKGELHSEEDIEKKRDYWQEIGILYQQLAKNFREKLNHQLANDFDRGVFEMRLRSANYRKRHGEAMLLRLYKLFSNFGGSIGKPVLWLIFGIFVVFPLLYYWLLPNMHHQGLLFFVDDLIKDSLKIASLTRADLSVYFEGASVWVEIVKVFQRILSATLVTLFIFAVRRRFKH